MSKKKINMRIKFYLLPVFIFVLGVTQMHAQDLKELRVKPDSSISEQEKQKALNIKNINVPIPKLDLKVNYWKHWTKLGLNFNQAQFSESWQLGGLNSWALMGLFWHKSEFNRNNFNFTTEVDMKYGKLKNEDQMPRPNNDRLFWDNKLSYKLSKSWAIYTSITVETQFDNAYNYGRDKETGKDTITSVKSSFMSPGYFTESVGLEYKPNKEFSLRFGTGTARQTLILDQRIRPRSGQGYYDRYGEYLHPSDPNRGTGARYGVEEDKNFKNELAFQLTANLDKNIAKNINLKARYNLFADYLDLNDPSHRLDATFSSRITSLINVSLGGTMIYDNNMIGKVQWSESLALGILLNLPK